MDRLSEQDHRAEGALAQDPTSTRSDPATVERGVSTPLQTTTDERETNSSLSTERKRTTVHPRSLDT